MDEQADNRRTRRAVLTGGATLLMVAGGCLDLDADDATVHPADPQQAESLDEFHEFLSEEAGYNIQNQEWPNDYNMDPYQPGESNNNRENEVRVRPAEGTVSATLALDKAGIRACEYEFTAELLEDNPGVETATNIMVRDVLQAYAPYYKRERSAFIITFEENNPLQREEREPMDTVEFGIKINGNGPDPVSYTADEAMTLHRDEAYDRPAKALREEPFDAPDCTPTTWRW